MSPTTFSPKRSHVRGGFGQVNARIDQLSDGDTITVYSVDVNGMRSKLIATFLDQPGIRWADVVSMARASASAL